MATNSQTDEQRAAQEEAARASAAVEEAEAELDDARTPEEKAAAKAELARAEADEKKARAMLKEVMNETLEEWWTRKEDERLAREAAASPEANPTPVVEAATTEEAPNNVPTTELEVTPENRSRWFGSPNR